MSNIGAKSPEFLRRKFLTIAGASMIAMTTAAGAATVQDHMDAMPVFHGATSADFQTAINSAANGTLYVPAGTYQAKDIIISNPVTIVFDKGVKIVPEFTGTGGKVFDIQSSDVTFLGDAVIDGTGVTITQSGNSYGVYAGNVANISNVKIMGLRVENFMFTDDPLNDLSIIVGHAFYFDNVNDLHLRVDTLDTSGAGVFIRDCQKWFLLHSNIKNARWYPLHINGGAFDFEIGHVTIDCSFPEGCYWGGMIDLMNQHSPLQVRSKFGNIHDIKFRGKVSYGGVIRCFSSENILIDNCDIEVSVGTLSIDNKISLYRIGTRGSATGFENGPSKNITVRGGKCVAGGPDQTVVYIDNQWQVARVPGEKILIEDIVFDSVDATNYFRSFCQVHGGDGGLEDVRVYKNRGTVKTGTAFVGGAIGAVGNNANGLVRGLDIAANSIRDTGVPASSANTGIHIGAYVDEVQSSSANTLDNFYYQVRTVLNSGPTLMYLDDQLVKNTGNYPYLFAVPLSHRKEKNENGTTANRPSGAAGDPMFAGRRYYDTTLDREILWSVTANRWKYPDGTNVL